MGFAQFRRICTVIDVVFSKVEHFTHQTMMVERQLQEEVLARKGVPFRLLLFGWHVESNVRAQMCSSRRSAAATARRNLFWRLAIRLPRKAAGAQRRRRAPQTLLAALDFVPATETEDGTEDGR